MLLPFRVSTSLISNSDSAADRKVAIIDGRYKRKDGLNDLAKAVTGK